MICQKCEKDFPEEEIELSHDIPKYLLGTDRDGRHYLCRKCHERYEFLILSRSMICIASICYPKEWKACGRNVAKNVCKGFFK